MTINELIQDLCNLRHIHGNRQINLCVDGFNRHEIEAKVDVKTAGFALAPRAKPATITKPEVVATGPSAA